MGTAEIAVSEAGDFIRGPEEKPGRAVHFNTGDFRFEKSNQMLISSDLYTIEIDLCFVQVQNCKNI